jgi:hypothetical protein
MVPDRGEVEVLEATEYVSVALPVPLAPDVTVIQEESEIEVYEQELGSVMLMDPLPPLEGYEADEGERAVVQTCEGMTTEA